MHLSDVVLWPTMHSWEPRQEPKLPSLNTGLAVSLKHWDGVGSLPDLLSTAIQAFDVACIGALSMKILIPHVVGNFLFLPNNVFPCYAYNITNFFYKSLVCSM